jgi:hypothetical protein
VPSRHRVRPDLTTDRLEEGVTKETCPGMKIGSGEVRSFYEVYLESRSGRIVGDAGGNGLRALIQAVIHVGYVELPRVLGRQSPQHVKQTGRVGAPGNGYDDDVPVGQHGVAVDGPGGLLDQSETGPPVFPRQQGQAATRPSQSSGAFSSARVGNWPGPPQSRARTSGPASRTAASQKA